MLRKVSKQKLIQLIHVARNELGLSEEDYRTVLDGAAGKTSCSEMTLFELEKSLDALKALGFRVKKMPVREVEVGAANREQIEYIKGMWECCARVKTDKALTAFVRRLTGAQHLRFLDVKNAQKVILALREMMAKAGYDPDAKREADG